MDISPAEFDEWSAAWHANKLRRSNCTVVYKCVATNSNGIPCDKAVSAKQKTGTPVCWAHRKTALRAVEKR